VKRQWENYKPPLLVLVIDTGSNGRWSEIDTNGQKQGVFDQVKFEILEGNNGKQQDLAATKLTAMFVDIWYALELAEHQQDVAERLRREALEREARQLRKQKERERRTRMGLNPDGAVRR